MRARRQNLLFTNDSGVIMIISLWILIVLSILALGMGRRTRINLALAKYTIAKTKADYLAWAGINYVSKQMDSLTAEGSEKKIDTLYRCGVYFSDDQKGQDIFKEIPLKEGTFDIRYNIYNISNNQIDVCYGIQDEGRRINLNALDSQSYKVLSYLLVSLGVESIRADEIASSAVDWKDSDNDIFNAPFGAEDDFYTSQAQAYHCKNLVFDNIEEMLLVRSMDDEILKKIRGYVTVFPKQAEGFFINVNTASEIVLKSFFYAYLDSAQASQGDADSLVSKIIAYRLGSDGKPCTSDDQAIQTTDLASLQFNTIEDSVFRNALAEIKEESSYYRIKVKGKSSFLNVVSEIEAVVNQENLAFVFWNKR